MAPRRKQPGLKRDKTDADEWADAAYEACAKAAAQWLKESVNVQRPICTLKLPEMKALAQAIIHKWQVIESERPCEGEPGHYGDGTGFV